MVIFRSHGVVQCERYEISNILSRSFGIMYTWVNCVTFSYSSDIFISTTFARDSSHSVICSVATDGRGSLITI